MTEPTIAELNERVGLLLEHVDTLRILIESHEFSLAAAEARALDLYCRGTNIMANRIADLGNQT